MLHVIKRDGTEVPFNPSKIATAISKAFNACNSSADPESIYNDVMSVILDRKQEKVQVEDIQDIIENILIDNKLSSEAKEFIRYRNDRTNIREGKSQVMRIMYELTHDAGSETQRENANINALTTSGTMLKYGSEVSKEYTLRYVIRPEISKLHRKGAIHLHDLDYYNISMNCLQIPLKKLLDHGFATGHGTLRQPQSIGSAAALAAIILQSNQNEMFGGQAFPTFDWDLAPYVGKSFIANVLKAQEFEDPNIDNEVLKQKLQDLYNENNTLIELPEVKKLISEHVYNAAIKWTERDTYQAMESFCHNLNTMQSRAGSQTVFSSVNYGMCTYPEARMLIKCLLETTMKGLGHHETQIFPIQIFKCKQGINMNPGEPNYDLFKLAIKCSAMRLFPSFNNQDAPYNLQYWDPNRPETEIATMGCRTRVMGNTYDPEHQQATSRGNFAFTTINLPHIALLAREACKDNVLDRKQKFWELYDKMIDASILSLEDRFELIEKRHLFNYPFLMGEGLYLDSEKFKPDDTIAEILKQSTLSVGFCGLAECLVALIGEHHGQSEDAQKLGLEIVKHLRDRMDEMCDKTGLSWSCFASPAESTCYTFLRKDRKRFGVIKGITDREYFTNSSHIPVYYDISAARKIDLEAPYHELCNAG